MNEEIELLCLHCKNVQPLTRFRVYNEDPLQLFDFCESCEEEFGFLDLYERYKKDVTPAVARHVKRVYSADPRYSVPARVARQKAMTEAIRNRDRKPTAAEKEMARRELMSRSLIFFTKQFLPNYKAGWMHHDICRRLEKFIKDIEDGKSPRLMITMPPRHGKSELASIRFPAFALGKHPEWEIIHATHTLSLTEGFSRKIRDVVSSPEYARVFTGTRLRKDTQNLQNWMTDVNGGYLAAGIGTGISGRGAHIMIIDDPVKDDEAADSESQRQNVMDWYTSTAASRLAPGAGVIVIMTRWHDADLAGRLLALQKELEEAGVPEEEIEKWDLVSYPMEAEADEYLLPTGQIVQADGGPPVPKARLLRKKGEPLHPDRYNELEMRRIKHRLMRTNPRHWNALYQQKPVPDEGEFFQTSMFRYLPDVPDWSEMRVLCAWDMAIGLKQRNDWTVGVVGALDYDDTLHILDLVRLRAEQPGQIDAMVAMIKRYKPFAFGIEHGQLGMSIRAPLEERLKKERLYVNFDETLRPVTDKQARAKPLQARMQVGAVTFPRAQPWVDVLRAEFLRFPNGEHDDQVDALAWLARMAQNVPVPVRPSKPKRKGWRDELHRYLPSSHKSYMSA